MSRTQADIIASALRAQRERRPDSLAQLRFETERALARMRPHSKVRRRDVAIGPMGAAWFEPPNKCDDAALLYLHGGAYIMGSINTHEGLTSRLSASSGIPCLSIDYRLAPENPFPAQLEDALAAYRWLVDTHGLNARRIAVAGDSAGGGLALSLLCAIRDSNLPLPAAAVCISPWVDLEGEGDSVESRAARDPMIDPSDLPAFKRLFLGEADSLDPRAAPIHADLTGLPPLLIHVGNDEVLLDDSTRIAKRAHAAGVDVRLEVWDGMFHVWHLFAPILEEGQHAIDCISNFVREHIPIQPIEAGDQA
jgi:acetyl esterase/lipase